MLLAIERWSGVLGLVVALMAVMLLPAAAVLVLLLLLLRRRRRRRRVRARALVQAARPCCWDHRPPRPAEQPHRHERLHPHRHPPLGLGRQHRRAQLLRPRARAVGARGRHAAVGHRVGHAQPQVTHHHGLGPRRGEEAGRDHGPRVRVAPGLSIPAVCSQDGPCSHQYTNNPRRQRSRWLCWRR